MPNWIVKIEPEDMSASEAESQLSFGTSLGVSPSGKLHVELDEEDIVEIVWRALIADGVFAYVE